MRAFFRNFFVERSPLTTIELIITIATLVSAVYILSPLLSLNHVPLAQGPAFVQALASTWGLFALGCVQLSAGLVGLYGIGKRSYKIRANAIFVNILLRLYTLIATWIVQGGLLPITWLSMAVVLIILIVLYVYNQRMSKLVRP